MRYADVEELCAAGLITDEQRRQIVERLNLKAESGGKFMLILSLLGAVLVASGVILLISANWDAIPRGVKIAVAGLLLAGAHAGGYYLREVHREYRKSGEALYLMGAGLFLANIGLIGQVYNLSARPPNAFLLWWAGIAALPWILRSQALHILSLLAFALWFGMEGNQKGSRIFFGDCAQYEFIFFAVLGLIYLGLGYCLERTRFADFASATQKLGLAGFAGCVYPLTWKYFYYWTHEPGEQSKTVFVGLAALALALLAVGLSQERRLTAQWRWTWGAILAGGLGLLAIALFMPWLSEYQHLDYDGGVYYHWIASIGLFVFCLLQIQVGVQRRSPFMVNLGVTVILLTLIATYVSLLGSMALTGLVFVIGGIFLIGFGVYLEKKRRQLVQQMKTPSA